MWNHLVSQGHFFDVDEEVLFLASSGQSAGSAIEQRCWKQQGHGVLLKDMSAGADTGLGSCWFRLLTATYFTVQYVAVDTPSLLLTNVGKG